VAKALEGLSGVKKVAHQKGSTVVTITRERGKPTDEEIIAELGKIANFSPRRVN